MSKGAGRFRHRVTLRSKVKTTNAINETIFTWEDIATVWAEVLELRGREYLESRELHSELTTKIRIRYRTDIDVEDQAVHGERSYNIIHIVDLMGKQRELELMCAEIK